jgi:hypothetical protein
VSFLLVLLYCVKKLISCSNLCSELGGLNVAAV